MPTASRIRRPSKTRRHLGTSTRRFEALESRQLLSAAEVLSGTQEHLDAGGYVDAFSFSWANDPAVQLSRAWQYFDLLGSQVAGRRTRLAVIDTGFMPGVGANADFAPLKDQYNFDPIGGLFDPTNATSSLHASWHGSLVLSVAAARLDNQFGSAGSGAQVVDPLIYETGTLGISHAEASVSAAVSRAITHSAQVINLSYGGEKFDIFDLNSGKLLQPQIDKAVAAGTIVVASAGNEEYDLNHMNYLPAELGGVIAVGAVDPDTGQAIRGATHGWGSNYGDNIDIWAPGDWIETTPVPWSPYDLIKPPPWGNGEATYFNGTSAAAPYVSGVVAMMKAIDPSLNHNDVVKILQDTASSSTDPRVKTGIINAYAAVKKAAEGVGYAPQPDAYELAVANDTFATATKLPSAALTATIAPGDVDYFYFDTPVVQDLDIYVRYHDHITPGNKLLFTLYSPDGVRTPLDINGTLTLHAGGVASGRHYLKVEGKNDVIVGTDVVESINAYTIPAIAVASGPTNVIVHSLVANGSNTVSVNYEIKGSVAAAFDIGFYLSADATFDGADGLLGSVHIASASDRTVGMHATSFMVGGGLGQISLPGAGAALPGGDHYVLAVADHLGQMEKPGDPTFFDNVRPLEGVYHTPGGYVMAHGTEGNDLVSVTSSGPTSVQVAVNANGYGFQRSDIWGVIAYSHGGDDSLQFVHGPGFGASSTIGVTFWAGAGNDMAHLTGSTGNDVASLYYQFGFMYGWGYFVDVKGATQITADGGPHGWDWVYLYDAVDPDHLMGNDGNTFIQGVGRFAYKNAAVRADIVYAQAVNGGQNSADLHDTPGDDRFFGLPTYSYMADASFHQFVYAVGFDEVSGHFSVGFDRADFFDSAGIDHFEGRPGASYMQGTGYKTKADGYDEAYAFATGGGYDSLTFHDSPGDDYFYGSGRFATLDGPGYYLFAQGFKNVAAESSLGGKDTMYIASLDYLFNKVGAWL